MDIKEVILKKRIVLVLLLISLIAIGVAIVSSIIRKDDEPLIPDYDSSSKEEYVEPLPDNNGTKLESEEGGGAVSLSFSNDVFIDLKKEVAEFYFANPYKSNHSILLRIVIQGKVIVQSGIIEPGNQLKKLPLLEEVVNILSSGGYDGYYEIFYYNSETGEQATVNTKIPVSILVE